MGTSATPYAAHAPTHLPGPSGLNRRAGSAAASYLPCSRASRLRRWAPSPAWRYWAGWRIATGERGQAHSSEETCKTDQSLRLPPDPNTAQHCQERRVSRYVWPALPQSLAARKLQELRAGLRACKDRVGPDSSSGSSEGKRVSTDTIQAGTSENTGLPLGQSKHLLPQTMKQ